VEENLEKECYFSFKSLFSTLKSYFSGKSILFSLKLWLNNV